MSESGLTYSDSGVNIDEAQRALRSVGDAIKASHTSQVVGGIGGFGGMFSLDVAGIERPTLVSSIDGVGTKTKVAAMAGDYSGLGHDIVNHCVNDILCQGAKPLFFLDYFGCSQLDAAEFEQVVGGAAEACREVGIPLIGGETAEMPGVYHDGEVDIVGAIVGMVDLDRRLPRAGIQAGDKIIGLASVGLHTNGFSLARKALFDAGGLSVRDQLPGSEETVAEALLKAHKCHYNSLYPLIQDVPGLRALAHITGGGLYENIPRVLPGNLQAVITRSSWEPLPVFRAIQDLGQISDREMFRTFNMGIGMIAVVKPEDAAYVVERLNAAGEHAGEIGTIQPGSQEVQIV
jgi:phosphoribosylformylglycinamidine cyclo-ligase